MLRMNNKGFAITTILYGILILFLMLLVSMLGILNTYNDRLEMLIENNNGARDIINKVSVENNENSESIDEGTEFTSITYTTHGEYEFNVPKTGQYKLEVWGAQGGVESTSYMGGYGGYSIGEIYLEKNTILYINVGGQGFVAGASITSIGGYNGGGSGSSHIGSGGGGGATHIATVSGELSTLEKYKGELYSDGSTYNSSKILIVAGGGGGYSKTACGSGSVGGVGGGYISEPSIYAATQTSGGSTSGQTGGSFGKGGYQSDRNHATPGGGGGWYGGGTDSNICNPGGGSGYVGSSLLTNKAMYCYNCTTSNEANTLTYSTTNVSDTPISNYAKKGNGSAIITLIQ